MSPGSIAAVLAMTGTGLKGRPRRRSRGLASERSSCFPAVGGLKRGIVARQVAAATGDPEPPTLAIANGLFLQQGAFV
jgi:hypothetical protein